MNGASGMEMNMGRDLALLLPEITLLVGAVTALVAQMLRRPTLALVAAVAGLTGATGLSLPLLGQQTTVFMGTYRIDELGVGAKLVMLPTVILVLLLVLPEVRGSDREGTVYSLLAFTTLGPVVLAGAGDMLFVVLGLLLSSLGSFALVAYPRTDRATEAGLKYFVYGSVTEAVMIFGLTFWYGATGSTLLADMGKLQDAPLAATAGLVGLIVGLGYKAAIVPFHFWSPDAYEGGPVAIAAFLSTVPKIGAIFALAQVTRSLPTGSGSINWSFVLAGLATLSMTYGNLAALSQTNLVRLLAYSSIAQAGYFLMGNVAFGRSELAMQGLILFAAAYAAMNLGAFALVARIGRELNDFKGLGRSAPWVAGTMVIFLLSLVGVPPLGGFVGKLLLFGAVLATGYTWLAVIAILNSALSLAVYLRIVVVMYQNSSSRTDPKIVPPVREDSKFFNPKIGTTVWITALILTFGLGLFAQMVL